MGSTLLKTVIAALLAIVASLQQAQYTINVQAGANLQTEMDEAPEGATLYLPPAAPFTGHFTCRKPLTLTTQGVTYAPSYEVQPQDSGKLAMLNSPDNLPAFNVGGVRDCRLIAIQVGSLHPQGTAVAYGNGEESSLDQIPVNPLMRQVLILGDPNTGMKRCVSFNAINGIIEGSYFAGCRVQGADSQAVYTNSGPGPYIFRNSYFEASSEPFLSGGASVNIQGMVPSDMLFDGMTFSKPLAWRSLKGWNGKTLFELKNARRVKVVNSRFENNWPDAQEGYAIVLTPRNQTGDGRNPWAVVEDVTFENNVLINVSSGFNILGEDNEKPSQRTNHITFRNTYIQATKTLQSPLGKDGNGYCGQIGRSPNFVTIDDLTCVNDGKHGIYNYLGGVIRVGMGFVFTNNRLRNATYTAFSGTDVATSHPIITLETYYPGYTWENNVIAGGSAKDYPAGTTIVPASTVFAPR